MSQEIYDYLHPMTGLADLTAADGSVHRAVAELSTHGGAAYAGLDAAAAAQAPADIELGLVRPTEGFTQMSTQLGGPSGLRRLSMQAGGPPGLRRVSVNQGVVRVDAAESLTAVTGGATRCRVRVLAAGVGTPSSLPTTPALPPPLRCAPAGRRLGGHLSVQLMRLSTSAAANDDTVQSRASTGRRRLPPQLGSAITVAVPLAEERGRTGSVHPVKASEWKAGQPEPGGLQGVRVWEAAAGSRLWATVCAPHNHTCCLPASLPPLPPPQSLPRGCRCPASCAACERRCWATLSRCQACRPARPVARPGETRRQRATRMPRSACHCRDGGDRHCRPPPATTRCRCRCRLRRRGRRCRACVAAPGRRLRRWSSSHW